MLPAVPVVFIRNVESAMFMLDIVPVNTKRVLLPAKLNPDAGVSPSKRVILNVVPAGACGKPIAQRSVAVELNPFNTNPLASWLAVLIANDLGSGEVTDCPRTQMEFSNIKNMNTSFFIGYSIDSSTLLPFASTASANTK